MQTCLKHYHSYSITLKYLPDDCPPTFPACYSLALEQYTGTVFRDSLALGQYVWIVYRDSIQAIIFSCLQAR